jgi:hypothetical protein
MGDINDGHALHRAAARDRVEMRAVGGTAAAAAFGDVQEDRGARSS